MVFIIPGIACFDYSEFPVNKGSNCQPGEKFENRVRATLAVDWSIVNNSGSMTVDH